MLPRRLLIAFAPLVVVLTLAAATTSRLPGDLWLAEHLQDLGDWYEPLATAARAITTTQTVLVLGAILGVTVWLLRERLLGGIVVLTIAVLPFLQANIKNFADRPRPSADLVEQRATFTSESFPSGHTMSGATLVFLVILVLVVMPIRPTLRWQIIGGATAVLLVSMVGDVYLGMHWPSDVVGGLLWAAVLVSAAAMLGDFLARHMAKAEDS